MESKAITRAVEKNGNEGKTMFEDKKITIEKVKDLIYELQNEFDNELDYDYKNYENITRIVNNTHELKDLSDMQLYGILKDFNYGSDKINFNRVDLDEVRFGLTEK